MSKTANTFSEITDNINDRADEIRDRIFSLIGSEHGNGQAFRRALNIESKNLITEWKSGRSKSFMKYIPQIAEFYGVSADWILGNSDVRAPEQKNNPDVNNDAEVMEMVHIFSQLSASTRSKLLELARLYSDAEHKNSETE